MSRDIITSYYTAPMTPYNSGTYSSIIRWNETYRNGYNEPRETVIPPIPAETENHQPINNFRKISL